MNYKNKGSWDARTYDQVSYLVQYRWGQQVLEWRKWQGKEIVMDAGWGSGLLTKQLAKKVPRGKVYAIDPNMIKQARNNLQLFDNVEIIQSSFMDMTPEHGQIAVVISGGVLLIPFGLSCVPVILRNKFAEIFTLIGFALMSVAAAIILISLSCRLPSDFFVIVMAAPFIITIIISTIIYFKKRMNR